MTPDRCSRRSSTPLAALLMSVAALLAACGGGGSSDPVDVAASRLGTTTRFESSSLQVTPIVGRGELKDARLVNTLSAAEIALPFGPGGRSTLPVVPLYDVRSYRLTYVTLDGQGREIVASGLLSLPVKAAAARSPVLSYQHGTIFRDAEAPSNNVVTTEAPVILASLGYIVLAADYVGYGASKGTPHPFLMATSTAAAVLDLLTAARTWRQLNDVSDNGQLFMAGYSEGGYATMAAHRALQASGSVDRTQLVGSAPGAGPYQLDATLDALLQRVCDENPLLGNLVSPGVLSHLGSTVRNEVRRLLIKAVTPDDADVSFQTTFIDNYLADDSAAIERDSNVHDWAPAAPVRMFHGHDDQTVPYVASLVTLQTMQARGSGMPTLADCGNAPSSHLGCIQDYFGYLLGQLAGAARDL